MTLNELNRYFNSFLHKEDYDSDISLNGIQISNSAPDEKPITKVAFAVDACEATAKKAAEAGAQVLFVHHGIFWGHCQTITGIHYKRVAPFIKNDLALIAYHAPLDANEFVGNNFGLARRIGLEKIRPFGKWRGMTLGAIGELPKAVTIEELAKKLFPDGEKPAHILPFGVKEIKKIAVISGGSGEDFDQAARIGADAYITGEISHEDYHGIEESGINVIAGGHYNTETVGVQLVQKRLQEDKGLSTVFIDIPTNL